MVTTAFVHIWGKRVGAIAWNPDSGIGSFEYEPGFIRSGIELAPFTMPLERANGYYSFPENIRSETFKGLPGLLADSLPDRYGHQLINTWLINQGRPLNSLNPIELLCFIGQRSMGALEYEPSITPLARDLATLEVNSLVETAHEILNEREEFVTNMTADKAQALNDILRIGTSAGGARPKAIVAFNEATGEFRSGQAHSPEGFDQWLIKLDGVSDAQFGSSHGYGRIEMAYYKLAIDCEINMAQCKLIEENGRAHFMTKRFDRLEDGNKLHVQTFCAIEHKDFNNVGAYSYEQLFQTMRKLRLSYPDAEQMFRRMSLNVMSKNCDDHTKNFAFMMGQDGVWKLAPAYDVCHAYRPDSQWVSQHALSVNGKRDLISRDDLLAVAKSMNIKKAELILLQIQAVVDRWEDYADQQGVDAAKRDAIRETIPQTY